MHAAIPPRLVVAAYLFLVTSTFGFIQPFLPLYLSAAGLSKEQIGFILGLATGLAFLVQPFLGRLSDRLDKRRPIIAACSALAAAAYLLLPFANGFGAFLVLAAIGANATLYLNAAGGVVVARMVREGGGGAAYANLRLWGSIGYILVATLTGLLLSGNANLSLSREGLDPVFRWGPLLFLAITALAWVLPDRKTDPTLATVGHSAGPNFRVFLVAYFLYLFALYGASSFLSLYLQSLGANSFWISLTFVGGVMVEVIVMRYAGYWSDHYGRRPLLLLSFFTLPLRLLLYIPAETPGAVAAVQLLHGINFGIMGAVAIVFANDLAGEGSHGLAQAKLAAATGLSGAFGPWILGAVAGRFGLPAMFLVAAVVALAAFAIMLLGVEDSRQESHALGERGPAWSRPIGRILDAPPRKKA